eukprot:TRINITY_DN1601_c0_g1_i5.p1 TRINITY_DN1601_c0_g1~~TRINITY_DN1601_c0_g1_i5.p1  ORF type:complete len:305 (-),score=-60.35 TRINITY_DN1601_c0_g1_i5:85-999(-)
MPNKGYTEIQRSQSLILLQCKSKFLCYFVSKVISSYEAQQYFKQCHTEVQRSQCLILLQCNSKFLCPFISNIIVSYKEQQQFKQLYTEVQRSQCLILLQCKSNFFRSFTFNIISPYQGQQLRATRTYRDLAQSLSYFCAMQILFLLLLRLQYYCTLQRVAMIYSKIRTEVQRNECLILLQCESNFFCSLASKIIPLYVIQHQQRTKGIPRLSAVSELFFCNASPIFFVSSYPILYSPVKSSIMISKRHTKIQCNGQISCLYGFQEMEYANWHIIQWFIIKITNDKIFYLSTLINEINHSFYVLS